MEVISERTAAGRDEEEEEDRGRLWMMLLIVSLKSRRRLVEAEKEEEGLGRWRGTCCSFSVSPGEEEKERKTGESVRRGNEGGERRSGGRSSGNE